MKRKEAFICLGVLLLLVFCFSCSNKKEVADQHYKAGLELSRKGETEAALAEYRLAMKEDKEVLDGFNKVYARKYGSGKGAQTYLNKAILVAAAVDEPYPAPDFTLVTLKDEEMKLSDHLGKVILVNFWKPG
jgi:hypothetical protein